MPILLVPVSLSEVVEVRGGPLTEAEIWAILCQSAETLQDLFITGDISDEDGPAYLISPAGVLFSSSGRVHFACTGQPNSDTHYWAPELYITNTLMSDTGYEKMYVYSLGKTLLMAADYKINENQDLPLLSADLELLLHAMQDEDPSRRIALMHILEACSLYTHRYSGQFSASHHVQSLYQSILGGGDIEDGLMGQDSSYGSDQSRQSTLNHPGHRRRFRPRIRYPTHRHQRSTMFEHEFFDSLSRSPTPRTRSPSSRSRSRSKCRSRSHSRSRSRSPSRGSRTADSGYHTRRQRKHKYDSDSLSSAGSGRNVRWCDSGWQSHSRHSSTDSQHSRGGHSLTRTRMRGHRTAHTINMPALSRNSSNDSQRGEVPATMRYQSMSPSRGSPRLLSYQMSSRNSSTESQLCESCQANLPFSLYVPTSRHSSSESHQSEDDHHPEHSQSKANGTTSPKRQSPRSPRAPSRQSNKEKPKRSLSPNVASDIDSRNGETAYEKYVKLKARQRQLRLLRNSFMYNEMPDVLQDRICSRSSSSRLPDEQMSAESLVQGGLLPELHSVMTSSWPLPSVSVATNTTNIMTTSDVGLQTMDFNLDRSDVALPKAAGRLDVAADPPQRTLSMHSSNASIKGDNSSLKRLKASRMANGPEFVRNAAHPVTRFHVPLIGESLKNPWLARPITVVLLNGERLQAVCDPTTTAQMLFECVVVHTNLSDHQLFGLTYITDSEHFFMSSDTKLHKVSPLGWREAGKHTSDPTTFTIYLRLKFYPKPDAELCHPETTHQLYLQLRHDMIEARLQCSDDITLSLVALAMQAEFSDYDKEAMGRDYYLADHYFSCAYLSRLGSSYIHDHLPDAHRDMRGLSQEQSESEYIQVCQKLTEYGIHFYKLYKGKTEPIPVWLGISPEALHTASSSQRGRPRTIDHSYAWTDTHKISFNKRRFSIQPKPTADDPKPIKSMFYTNSYKKGKYLLQLITAQHRHQIKERSKAAINDLTGSLTEQSAQDMDVAPLAIMDDTNLSLIGDDSPEQETDITAAFMQAHTLALQESSKALTTDHGPAPVRYRSSNGGQLPLQETSIQNNGHCAPPVLNRTKADIHNSIHSNVIVPPFLTESPDSIEVLLTRDADSKEFGITIMKNVDHGAFIAAITPGSLTERNGQINLGDRLIAVNGQRTDHIQHLDAVEMICQSKDQVLLLLSPKRKRKHSRSVKSVDLPLNDSNITPLPSSNFNRNNLLRTKVNRSSLPKKSNSCSDRDVFSESYQTNNCRPLSDLSLSINSAVISECCSQSRKNKHASNIHPDMSITLDAPCVNVQSADNNVEASATLTVDNHVTSSSGDCLPDETVPHDGDANVADNKDLLVNIQSVGTSKPDKSPSNSHVKNSVSHLVDIKPSRIVKDFIKNKPNSNPDGSGSNPNVLSPDSPMSACSANIMSTFSPSELYSLSLIDEVLRNETDCLDCDSRQADKCSLDNDDIEIPVTDQVLCNGTMTIPVCDSCLCEDVSKTSADELSKNLSLQKQCRDLYGSVIDEVPLDHKLGHDLNADALDDGINSVTSSPRMTSQCMTSPCMTVKNSKEKSNKKSILQLTQKLMYSATHDQNNMLPGQTISTKNNTSQVQNTDSVCSIAANVLNSSSRRNDYDDYDDDDDIIMPSVSKLTVAKPSEVNSLITASEVHSINLQHDDDNKMLLAHLDNLTSNVIQKDMDLVDSKKTLLAEVYSLESSTMVCDLVERADNEQTIWAESNSLTQSAMIQNAMGLADDEKTLLAESDEDSTLDEDDLKHSDEGLSDSSTDSDFDECLDDALEEPLHRPSITLTDETKTEIYTNSVSVIEVMLEKRDGTLGLNIAGGNVCNPHIYVKSLVPGSPAALSGDIHPGDHLLVVNGISLDSFTHKEAVDVLRCAKNTCALTIQRHSDSSSNTVPSASANQTISESRKLGSPCAERQLHSCDFSSENAISGGLSNLSIDNKTRHSELKDAYERYGILDDSTDEEVSALTRSFDDDDTVPSGFPLALTSVSDQLNYATVPPLNLSQLALYGSVSNMATFSDRNPVTSLNNKLSKPVGKAKLALDDDEWNDSEYELNVLTCSNKQSTPAHRGGNSTLHVSSGILIPTLDFTWQSDCDQSGYEQDSESGKAASGSFDHVINSSDSSAGRVICGTETESRRPSQHHNNATSAQIAIASLHKMSMMSQPSDAKQHKDMECDAHTYQEFEVCLQKECGKGLGFTVAGGRDTWSSYCYIKAILHDPALADGRLQPGDKLMKVNGIDMNTMTHFEAITFFRRLPDTVTVEVCRESSHAGPKSLKSGSIDQNDDSGVIRNVLSTEQHALPDLVKTQEMRMKPIKQAMDPITSTAGCQQASRSSLTLSWSESIENAMAPVLSNGPDICHVGPAHAENYVDSSGDRLHDGINSSLTKGQCDKVNHSPMPSRIDEATSTYHMSKCGIKRIVIEKAESITDLGLVLQPVCDSHGILILRIANIHPHSLAAHDGQLRIGDKVLQVNEQSVIGVSPRRVSGMLTAAKEKPGTLLLTIYRPSSVDGFINCLPDQKSGNLDGILCSKSSPTPSCRSPESPSVDPDITSPSRSSLSSSCSTSPSKRSPPVKPPRNRVPSRQSSSELIQLGAPIQYLTEKEFNSLPVIPPRLSESPGYSEDELVLMIAELNGRLDHGGVHEEFKKLRSVKHRDGTCAIGKLDENRTRNRYRNVLPYDYNRVKLGSSDSYINASHVTATVAERTLSYIACQGPMSNTREDFWQMLWEQKVAVIVMVTMDTEADKLKCCRYLPPSEDVSFVIKSRWEVRNHWSKCFTHCEIHQLGIVEMKTKEEHNIIHMNFTGWTQQSVPASATQLLRFLHQLHMLNASGPVVVHCSAGIGRTGAVIAIDIALSYIQQRLPFSLYDIVCELRQQRPGMVQTKDQYGFCYKACLEVLETLLKQKQKTSLNQTH